MKRLLRIALERRERILALAVNEIKRRYVASFLGIFWTFLEPLAIILIFSLIFPILLKVSFREWVIFFIAGLIPFRFLNRGSIEAVRSLSEYRSLLEKMKIEQEEIILAKVFSNFIYFLMEMVVFFPIILFLGALSFSILFLPLLFLSSIFLVLSFGFLFSQKCVKYRDIEYMLGIAFQLLFFLAPIVYRPENIPPNLSIPLLFLPTSSIIYSFQLIFLERLEVKPIYPTSFMVVYSFFISLTLLAITYKLFIRKKGYERKDKNQIF